MATFLKDKKGSSTKKMWIYLAQVFSGKNEDSLFKDVFPYIEYFKVDNVIRNPEDIQKHADNALIKHRTSEEAFIDFFLMKGGDKDSNLREISKYPMFLKSLNP